MVESIQRFGLAKGVLLGSARICRCQPLDDGGVDEVPEVYPLSVRRVVCGVPHGVLGLLARWKTEWVQSPRGSR